MERLPENFLVAIVLMIIFSSGVLACSCGSEPLTNKTIDEIRNEKRKYFLDEFSGAAFVGKIVRRERVSVTWMAKTLAGKSADFQMYKYTIRVSEYWLGVKSPTIVVYSEPDEQIYHNSGSGSSCGFKLNTGKTYFFTPGFYENNLTIGQCDFAGGGSEPNEYAAKEFRTIMGEPKQF